MRSYYVETVEYRDIPGFPGYRVGSDGSVWGCRSKRWMGATTKWKTLKADKLKKCGHLRVTLRPGRHHRLVHRLVLEAFIGPCPDGMEACHYPDRNPENNHLSNLRWDTRRENVADSVKHGTRVRGERTAKSKLTAIQVLEIRDLLSTGWTMQALADKYGVRSSSICNIKQRKAWSHV